MFGNYTVQDLMDAMAKLRKVAEGSRKVRNSWMKPRIYLKCCRGKHSMNSLQVLINHLINVLLGFSSDQYELSHYTSHECNEDGFTAGLGCFSSFSY